MNQGPAYFGDLDENDEKLLEFERAAEQEGTAGVSFLPLEFHSCVYVEWEEQYTNLRETLGLPSDDPIPALSDFHSSAKRKSTEQDDDVDMSVADEGPNRSKTITAGSPEVDQARIHAQAAVAFIPFLTADDLLAPKLPSREEMETVLLGLRKQALVEEYFGADNTS
jgi:pre-mRNA-splicing factor ISY1